MPITPNRPALAGLVLAIFAALAISASSVSAQQAGVTRYDKIASTALAYEGTYQGQCWPWVQRVVLEATGKQIGFDYREGFFEAGAVEVSLHTARSGDIIQIADDSYTAPDADYAGLHTSIVLTNHGDGSFDVIDSNSQWDGVVRIRAGYEPYSAAARYGLDVHIYRIDPDALPPADAGHPSAVAPTAGGSFTTGDSARVNAGPEGLNLREGPGLGERIVMVVPDGTQLKVVGEPVTVGGRTWVKVRVLGLTGWVASEYLVNTTPAAASNSDRTVPVTPAEMPFRSFIPMISVN